MATKPSSSDADSSSQDSSRASRRELVTLAWPIAAAMLGDTLMGIVDTKLAGGLGAAALAAVGMGTILMHLNYSIVYGLMRAVKVRTAYAIGQKNPEDGNEYAKAGIVLGALVGGLVFAIGRDVSRVLRLFGVAEDIIPLTRDFFAAVTCGAPSACIMVALIQHRQATGDTRRPMVIELAANVINALVAYSLVYGKFGLPALGVRGAGYATAIAHTAAAVLLLTLLVKDRYAVRSRLPLQRAIHEVLTLGTPTGLQFGAEIFAITMAAALIGSMAPEQLAAHQIGIATIRISFLPGLAVSEAACVIVGRSLGERNIAAADLATRHALILATSFMTACGVVFGLFGRWIASLITTDLHVIAIAERLLWVAALFQLLDAVNVVLRGALRGAKDVRVPALIGIVVVWTSIPGCALLLGKLAGMGALGVWIGFVFETTLGSALFWWRWRRGPWRSSYQSDVAPLPTSSALA